MTVTETAENFLSFIDASPSPFHAVEEARAMLIAAGFVELRETDRWTLEAGGAYFFVRGGKTVLAWRQGAAAPAEAGLRIIAAHSDSPVLKVRVKPGKTARDQYLLATEIYGSPLLYTWLDRDLKFAGRLYYRGKDGLAQFSLIDRDDLLVRVNSLAPHLRKTRGIETVTLDKHNDLAVTLCGLADGDGDVGGAPFPAVLYDAIGVSADDGLGYELCLADTLPACLTGSDRSFISAPRLDNLFSAWCALSALCHASQQAQTQLAVVYDAEEIGSETWTGAGSNILDMALARINGASGGDGEDLARAKARSIFISADMAHAEHPSHPDATDPDHVPAINGGLAVKTSARGNYAIGQPAAAWFANVCADARLSLQRFMYRCDHGGGSSVGPIVSTSAGICGIDVGAPMLAMHSIREMAGAHDLEHTIKAFTAFYVSDAVFAG